MNLTIGDSNHSDMEREEHDFYATDPIAIRELLKVYNGFQRNIWECCCGQGHLSKELISHGYDVFSSDLINRGYGVVYDVLTMSPNSAADIITNPPI